MDDPINTELVANAPGWASALPLYFHILESPYSSPWAIKEAKEDLAEMAKAADKWSKHIKDKENFLEVDLSNN